MIPQHIPKQIDSMDWFQLSIANVPLHQRRDMNDQHETMFPLPSGKLN